MQKTLCNMDLAFNQNIGDTYKSKSQKTRVITETWVRDNMYCPICGNPTIEHYPANKPVADFFLSMLPLGI